MAKGTHDLQPALDAFAHEQVFPEALVETVTDVEIPDRETYDVEEVERILRQELTEAENELGQGYEEKFGTAFWHYLETRPYMEALASLAEFLNLTGGRKEAIAIYERMLRLNPIDNQGVRYPLLGIVLAERALHKAKRLFEMYPKEQYAWFTYGQTLYAFVMKDRPRATRLLKAALKLNPQVPKYLFNFDKLPRELPDRYSLGDESEAILAAAEIGEAWYRRQNAMLWLNGQMSGDPGLIRWVARTIDR